MNRYLGVLFSSWLIVALAPEPVRAVHFNVSGRTVGDGYQLVTSDNELLNRRRLHQYLGFGAYDITGDGTNTLAFVSMLRFDADFGITSDELEDIETLRQHLLTIQMAVIEGRDIGGFLDFSAGRFIHSDAIDMLMMDGVRLMFETPWFFGVELLAGVETKDDMARVNANQMELDGVRLIEDFGYERTNDAATIVIGAALVTRNLAPTTARVSYRRLFSGSCIDQEKIAAAVATRIAQRLHLAAVASFDFFNERFDRIEASLRARIADFFDVDGQYVRLLPSFDADSIFNIFSAFALNDVNVRFRLHVLDSAHVYLGGMLRFFGNEDLAGDPGASSETALKAYGGMAGYWHRFGDVARLALDLSLEGGYGGERVLADIGVRYSPLPRVLDLDARVTLVHFTDELQANLRGLSFGYQIGARYHVHDRAAVSIVGEHNFNRIHSSQFRLLALLDLDFFL